MQADKKEFISRINVRYWEYLYIFRSVVQLNTIYRWIQSNKLRVLIFPLIPMSCLLTKTGVTQ